MNQTKIASAEPANELPEGIYLNYGSNRLQRDGAPALLRFGGSDQWLTQRFFFKLHRIKTLI